MLGQEAGVCIDCPEPRDSERVRRDLPGEPHAQHEVGLVEADEWRDSVAASGNHDIEPLRRVPDELVEGVSVAVRVLPRAEQRDHLVSELAKHPGEPLDRGWDLRDEDDLQPSPARSSARAPSP
jgi:hypothetical protein